MAANEVEGGGKAAAAAAAHPSGEDGDVAFDLAMACALARAPLVLLNGAEWTPFSNLEFYRAS